MHETLKRQLRQHRLRTAEFVGITTTAAAFAVTILLVSTGAAQELNPWVLALLDTAGWAAAGVVGIGFEAAAFWYLRRHQAKGAREVSLFRWSVGTVHVGRLVRRGGWAIAAIGVGDLLVNLYWLAQVGLPESVHVSAYGPPVALVAGSAALMLTWPVLRRVPSPSPQVAGAALFAVVLIVSSPALAGVSLTAASGSTTVSTTTSATGSGTVEADFESGSLSDNWNNIDNAYSISTASAFEGDNGVEWDQTTTQSNMDNDLTDTTPSSVSWYYRLNRLPSSAREQVFVMDSNSNDQMEFDANSDGNWYVYDDTTKVTLLSNPQPDKWYKIKFYNIDYSSNTYSAKIMDKDGNELNSVANLQFETNASSSSFIRIQNYDSAGYADFFAINGATISSAPDINGTVRDSSDNPVANATVVATASYPNLTEDARDLREQYQNATPDVFQPNLQLTGSSGLMTEPGGNGKYVAVHTREQWELGGYGGDDDTASLGADPSLDNPQVVLEEDATHVLSLWNAQETPLLQDNVNEDLPGTTSSGEIVISRVDAANQTIERLTPETSPYVKTYYGGQVINTERNTHEAVEVSGLPIGFYHVAPKGNPSAGYMIAIAPNGNLERMDEQPWVQGLKTKAGTLTERAQQYKDITNKNGVAVFSTNASANGSYSFDNIPGNPEEVHLKAFRAPDGMTASDYSGDYPTWGEITQYQNDTLNSLREQNATLDDSVCGGAAGEIDPIYRPDGGPVVSPPKQGVDVPTKKIGVSSDVATLNQLCLQEDIEDLLRNSPLEDLLGRLDLEDMSTEELKQLYRDLRSQVVTNDVVCQKWLEQEGVDNVAAECDKIQDSIDDGGGSGGGGVYYPPGVPSPDDSREEIEDAVRNISQTVTSVGITGEACEPEVTERTNSSITVQCETGIDGLDASDAIIQVHRSNGTTDLISGNNSSYVTVEDTLGGDTVRLKDYPLGNTSSVQVAFKVFTPEGIAGGDSDPIRNPDFTGEMPNVQAIRLSCSQCESGDRVQVEVIPGDDTTVKKVSQVRADGPGAGAGPPVSTPANNKAAFNLDNGTGVYRTEVVIQSSSGHNFTEIVKLEATDASTARPPTLRATTGPIGTYAIVSDGFASGAVTASANGDQIRALGIIPSDGDAPTRTHVYTAGLEPSASHDTKVVVARGVDSEQQLGQRVGDVLHEPAVGEEGIIYRQDHQALPRSGSNQYGRVTTTLQNGTVIETFSEPSGAVSISTNANPGWVDRQVYRLRLTFPDAAEYIPNPDVPDLPGIIFPSGGIGLLGAAIGLIGRRGWSA